MIEYWLDPPECYIEPPECCGDYMDVHDDGSAECKKCGKRIEPEPDVAPPESILDELPEDDQEIKTCAHGKEGDCDACDAMSDFLFDAKREQRLFGK